MSFLAAVPADVVVPDGLDAVVVPELPDAFVAVVDDGEPLVDLADAVATLPAYVVLGFEGAVTRSRARTSVAQKLRRAARQLPTDFGLVVLDGHRTAKFQRRLVERYGVAGDLVEGFVADPESQVLIPPHTTGGAVDLTLSYRGEPLALGTDFDAFVPEAALDAFEGTPGAVRELRRLLASVLRREGFVGYPLEWWHWSYGEQVWAFNTNGTARYGPVED